MRQDPIVIVSIARTPIGNLLGELKSFSATNLGTAAIQAAIERAKLKSSDINEVIMGCVLPAGLGQAPARQAALHANIPVTTPCSTINKVCGSGMKAVMMAHDMIAVGSAEIMLAGGMESMSNAPYLLTKARNGYRFGHGQLYDHMMLDGLEDAYDKGQAMGIFAEQTVKQFGFTRKQQDEFAFASFERAREASETAFRDEIVPMMVQTKQGEIAIEKDEHPFSVNPDNIPKLKPAFITDGTVTAGNSSSIADGAAALILMKLSVAEKHGCQPLAIIHGSASYADQPARFPTAPIYATDMLLKRVNWKREDVDLFEVNEAFAAVALAYMHELKLPHDKVNIHGGGIALGHPIGASGARILVTLINALMHHRLKKGIASLCIGGGEATAIAVELFE